MDCRVNNGVSDVFIHDRNTDETSAITVGAFLPNGTSHSPVASEHGVFIAFSSDATNLVYGDENNASDIFVYERSIGALTRVSVDTQGNDLGGDAENPSISGGGRYVAFELHFIDPLTSERTGNAAIFIRDRHTGFTTRLVAEGEAYAGNMRSPSVSFDGRMIAFEHEMSGGASAENSSWAVSVYDQDLETVRLLALNSDGVAANDESIQAVPNGDGTVFAFTSSANNLVVDGNLVADVFSRELQPAVKVNKLSLLPVAPAVLATDQVVVDLVMDFGVDVTLGGGLEVLYDNSLLNFVSFVPDIALADDPVFRAFIAPEVLNDGGLQSGVISFGDFDGLSGTRKIGTFTFSPKSSSTVGIAHISLVNNVAPYGGFYGANTYVGQPVKYEDTTISIGVDTDGDGYVNSLDAFPDDQTEWADTDGDGLGDNQEIALGTDPNSSDSDNDSIIDSVEVALGTNPVSVDSDGDTISDIDELNFGFNPNNADSDSDGVSDAIDAFPVLSTEWNDFDGDGFGDNADPQGFHTYAWTQSYVGDGHDNVLDIAIDGQNNAYHVGFAGDIGGYLERIDADGNRVWRRSLGVSPYKLAVDVQGNAYVIGVFSNTAIFDPEGVALSRSSAGSGDAFIIKYDANGVYQGLRTWGGTSADDVAGVSASSGGIYVTGSYSGTVDFGESEGGDVRTAYQQDSYVTKFDSDFNRIWTNTIGGAWNVAASAITTDQDGNAYIAGRFRLNIVFDDGVTSQTHNSVGNDDVFIARFNVDGSYDWSHTFGSASNDSARAIAVDSDSGVHVTGVVNGGTDYNPTGGGDFRPLYGSRSNVFVTNLTTSGAYVRTHSFGGRGGDQGNDIAIAEGRVFVGGVFEETVDFNPDGNADVHSANNSGLFLTVLDMKNYAYEATHVADGFFVDGINAVASAPNGDVYTAGYFNGNTSFTGSVDFNPGDEQDVHTAIQALEGFVTKWKFTPYDSDGDGMPNTWEILHGLNAKSSADSVLDSDNDLLSNIQEYLLGTNPELSDTDGDGEADNLDAFPVDQNESLDTDGDGDGDGVGNNSDLDMDGDTLPNWWELASDTLNPLDATDAASDFDSDGLNALGELAANTDPDLPDTDVDGLLDGQDDSPLDPVNGLLIINTILE